ncbi:MAG TPA: DUF3261 domain-containing protein [Caulobacterales bacterium]|nr:DUF3261 domain-containing protein [Caulobacterales bacterium]
MRRLILATAALASACATKPATAPVTTAHIAPDVALTLPTPPGYPQARTLHQIVRGRFAERSGVVEALLSLSPERVDIVLTAVSGPRLATLTWDERGVREDRTLLGGDQIPAQNILSDIFVSLWPEAAVRASLPADAALEADGPSRAITHGGAVVLEMAPDPEHADRLIVRNHALGYELTIITQAVQ